MLNDVPITGFIVHSEDENSQHSHKLFITSWNGRQLHVHQFAGITSFNAGHKHDYSGTTAPAPSGVPHTHEYYATTTFNDGHSHVIKGTTGPAIPIPGGGHIHRFEGTTTLNGTYPHVHSYKGQTGNEIASC